MLRALLSDPERGWAASELADACDLTRQTALLHLRCLTRRGFVQHDEELGQFRVGDTDDAYEVLARPSNRAM